TTTSPLRIFPAPAATSADRPSLPRPGPAGEARSAALTATRPCAVPKPGYRLCTGVLCNRLGCFAVLADQALAGLPAVDRGGHIDRPAGLVQRGSLFPRLVGPVIVVVLRVLGQDLPKVLFAVDEQMVEALAPRRSRHIAP